MPADSSVRPPRILVSLPCAPKKHRQGASALGGAQRQCPWDAKGGKSGERCSVCQVPAKCNLTSENWGLYLNGGPPLQPHPPHITPASARIGVGDGRAAWDAAREYRLSCWIRSRLNPDAITLGCCVNSITSLPLELLLVIQRLTASHRTAVHAKRRVWGAATDTCLLSGKCRSPHTPFPRLRCISLSFGPHFTRLVGLHGGCFWPSYQNKGVNVKYRCWGTFFWCSVLIFSLWLLNFHSGHFPL